jgi:hypothetical protein
MAYILLRRTITPDPGNPGGLVATEIHFDTVKRTRHPTQFSTLLNNPEELDKDEEVFRYEYAPGKTRVVYYNGNGSVYTKNLKVPGGPFSPTLKVKATPNVGVTSVGRKDAYLDLTGQGGFPPYQVEVVGESGPAKGYYQAGVSQSEVYPMRCYNLGEGGYTLRVRDKTGDGRTLSIQVGVAQYGYAMGPILRDTIVRDRFIRLSWRPNALDTSVDSYSASQIKENFTIAYGTLVDGFLLPGSNGTIWRQVYAGYQKNDVGPAEVYFVDTSTVVASSLSLENLILFNPTSGPEQNGGCVLEMRATDPAITFTLGGVTNTTGRFDGLGAGLHAVTVADSLGTSIVVSFTLTQRYAIHWYLDFSDLDGVPCRLEMWERDYDGLPQLIKGQNDPVLIKSDGLGTALGGQGDLPPVVGSSCQLNLKARLGELEDVTNGDDRLCRVDVRRAGQLRFRGYVQPAVYEGELQDGLINISVMATDGLAGLKGTYFTGHNGQRLTGYRPILNSLLHCLSRCEVSLPLRIFTNSRDVSMATTDAPEQAAATNRTGFYFDDKDEPDNCRTVVDAQAQALRGTLVQREGTWQIRSIHEAATEAEGRSYLPAGTELAAVVAPAPSGTILAPKIGVLHWLRSVQPQKLSVRQSWKSLTGSTDIGWRKNAYPAGDVFSDKYAWLEDLSQLRTINGWAPPTGTIFPLVLQQVGDKGSDLTTQWPRSQGLSVRDGRYLAGPELPLVGGPEAIPAYLTITGKFVATDFYLNIDGVSTPAPNIAKEAFLPYEIIIDGRSLGAQQAKFELSKDGKDITFEAPLPALPAGALSAELRVYTWTAPDAGQLSSAYDLQTAPQPLFDTPSLVRDRINGVERLFIARRYAVGAPLTDTYNWEEIPATNASSGRLFISSIGVQLRPQESTWDGKDFFRADGPGGTVRPTDVLPVYHADVPIAAGLFSGNLPAFGKTIANTDGTMTTSWSRSIDLAPTPLFESIVLDGLSLRSGNSKLLTGALSHRGTEPVYLLDTLDAPNDVPGRRFFAGAVEWSLKFSQVRMSLIENGAGADAPDPYAELPDGVRITHGFYEYKPDFFAPVARGIHDGSVRVRG